jgi:hypothetical protein
VPIRFHDAGQTIYDFGATFLVVCPRCHRCASVVPLPGTEPKLFSPRRLTCARCGYSKDWHGDMLSIGRPVDWYFRQPLWLQTPCCGQTLWAYNEDHLNFLEEYVRADVRERLPNRNASLASRLPGWMKDARNRAEVLRGIERLKQKLTGMVG